MNISRKLSVDVLQQVLNEGAYSNIVLRNALNKSNINDRDKALVTEIVYGTIKYKYTLDKIVSYFYKQKISSLDSYILNVLRSAIYQIRFLDKIPEFAAVDEAVEIVKKQKSIGASKLVNGILRNYLRNKDTIFYNENSTLERLCFNYSFEPWMVKFFIQQFGVEITERILGGLNTTPYVTVRINSLKTDYEGAFCKLESLGYKLEEGYAAPEAINIIHGKSIENNPLFNEGIITVQDESAMLVAPCLELDENLHVLDLCSAPGGKTTHISELMNNRGNVYAFDIHDNKLNLIRDNAQRLGITNIECEALDSSQICNKLINIADRILVDAPCSGLGIIRKKPEIKWAKSASDIDQITDIQRKILSNAANYLKKNGVLVYSTCTINKKENQDIIEWFVKQFPWYTIEPLYFGKLSNFIYHEQGFVTILPNEAMDGFFICKLKNNGR